MNQINLPDAFPNAVDDGMPMQYPMPSRSLAPPRMPMPMPLPNPKVNQEAENGQKRNPSESNQADKQRQYRHPTPKSPMPCKSQIHLSRHMCKSIKRQWTGSAQLV
jgi:hypothetical protein